jgi:hypothetical protein
MFRQPMPPAWSTLPIFAWRQVCRVAYRLRHSARNRMISAAKTVEPWVVTTALNSQRSVIKPFNRMVYDTYFK